MTERLEVFFGAVEGRDGGSPRRIDASTVDGVDIGLRFLCRVSKKRGVTSHWFVDGDPTGQTFGNWIFARDRAYEMAME